MNEIQRAYLDRYLDSLSELERARYTTFCADYFCADESNANLCAELVRQGKKKATCGMKLWYEQGMEQAPESGDLLVVTDWVGNPSSIVEFTEITECRFSEVTESFAAAEGEGDLSLEWWREAHREFFSRECEALGIPFSEDCKLVLEHFRLVYSE